MTQASTRKRARSSGTRRPSTGRGRKIGQTSPAIARAARRVGQLGGRPPAKLPADLLKELGAPPVDVLEKDAWWSRLIEILTWGDLEGEAWGTKLERAVKASGAAAKLREGELKALVAKLLEREEAETNNDASPKLVERKDPSATSKRGAVRRDPS